MCVNTKDTRKKKVQFTTPLESVAYVKTYYRTPKLSCAYSSTSTRRQLRYDETECAFTSCLTEDDEAMNDTESESSSSSTMILDDSNVKSTISYPKIEVVKNYKNKAVVLSANLKQCGEILKIGYWTSRYVELHATSVLVLYRCKNSSVQLESVSAKEYRACVVNSNEHTFALYTRKGLQTMNNAQMRYRLKNTKLVFKCESKQQMYDWIRALNTVSVCPLEVAPLHDIEVKSVPKVLNLAKKKGTTHLLFVRHAQCSNLNFVTSDCEKSLTPMGVQQSHCTGSYLQEYFETRQVQMSDHPQISIIHSGLTRAAQTAKIIQSYLVPKDAHPIGKSKVPTYHSNLVCEGYPVNLSASDRKCHRMARLKMAYKILSSPDKCEEILPVENNHALNIIEFEKVFNPSKSDVRFGDRYRIIVCHAQVIHYFVCRALGMESSKCLDGSTCFDHGSVSQLSILPSGEITIHSMNQSAHLPPNLQTQK